MPALREPTQTTTDDREWWDNLAPTLAWRYAKTMPNVPHSYVVAGRTPGFSKADAIRAARVIQAYGRPAKFNGRPKIYLDGPAPSDSGGLVSDSGDGRARYWVEFSEKKGETVEDCRLVNVAVTDDVWDDGTAPVTETGEATRYDYLAAGYDEMYYNSSDEQENAEMRSLIFSAIGDMDHAPATLDIGAGTGLLLDLGLTSPRVYTGVDPSRGMLNKLFRKHSKVERVIPATAAEALPILIENGETFELVASLFGSLSYCDPDDVNRAMSLVEDNGTAVFMAYREGYAPAFYEGEDRAQVQESAENILARLQALYGPAQKRVGDFDVWVIHA